METTLSILVMTKLLFILLLLFGCETPTESEDLHGCLDSQACNYNSDATIDNNSCEYAEENFDCDGNCIVDVDVCGVCNGDNSTCAGCPYPDSCNYNADGTDEESCWYADDGCLCADGEDALVDECGVCNGDGSSCEDVYGCTDEDACNFNPNANIFDNSCFYAEDWEDECGVCDLVPSNDCTQDECGIWGGDGPDENFDCDGNCIVDTDCEGVCGGDAVVDECGYTIDDLVGTWDKTSGTDTLTTSVSGGISDGESQTQTETWVADALNSETLVISADGTFTIMTVDDGYVNNNEASGMFTVSGNNVTFTVTDEGYGEQTLSGTVSISGTTATFHLTILDSYTSGEVTYSIAFSFNWIYEKVIE